jgi:hypothetical protein
MLQNTTNRNSMWFSQHLGAFWGGVGRQFAFPSLLCWRVHICSCREGYLAPTILYVLYLFFLFSSKKKLLLMSKPTIFTPLNFICSKKLCCIRYVFVGIKFSMTNFEQDNRICTYFKVNLSFRGENTFIGI